MEERRHQADMLLTFKIVRGIDRVDHSTWFQLGAETGRATRSADDPLNLRQKAARLEVRRHFFSNRVVEAWNLIPCTVKNTGTLSVFKRAYKKHRAEMVNHTYLETILTSRHTRILFQHIRSFCKDLGVCSVTFVKN
jgi:hypothetical protein